MMTVSIESSLPAAWNGTSSRGRFLRGAVCFLVLIVASGCHEFQKPRWDASDKRLLAVPFREPRTRNGFYLWSEKGRVLVSHLRHWVETNTDNYLVGGEEVRELFESIQDWDKDTIRREDWARLTENADFDILLVGDIVLSHKRPQDVNFYRGRASVRYKIVETRTGRALYDSGPEPIEVVFPPESETNVPVSMMDFDDKKSIIEEGLLRRVAEQIGKDLYGYYES